MGCTVEATYVAEGNGVRRLQRIFLRGALASESSVCFDA